MSHMAVEIIQRKTKPATFPGSALEHQGSAAALLHALALKVLVSSVTTQSCYRYMGCWGHCLITEMKDPSKSAAFLFLYLEPSAQIISLFDLFPFYSDLELAHR
ncbi:hypothetical protein KIL84_006160 [Mauremys mutica]|uniref:Uncharacterized protein n=1 Tax=Mauremys mutica TaxID=74926 RepID=A0A9D3WYS4_9SAUR|nr:hypothetical protein KIL84_006160 [Mauremys mutica]